MGRAGTGNCLDKCCSARSRRNSGKIEIFRDEDRDAGALLDPQGRLKIPTAGSSFGNAIHRHRIDDRVVSYGTHRGGATKCNDRAQNGVSHPRKEMRVDFAFDACATEAVRCRLINSDNHAIGTNKPLPFHHCALLSARKIGLILPDDTATLRDQDRFPGKRVNVFRYHGPGISGLS